MKILSNRKYRYMRMSLEIANEVAELNESIKRENKALVNLKSSLEEKVKYLQDHYVSRDSLVDSLSKGYERKLKDVKEIQDYELCLQREICAEAYVEAMESIGEVPNHGIKHAIQHAYNPGKIGDEKI